MRDAPKVEHNQNIRAGLSILDTKYGLHMDEYDYLDSAVDALRDIKNYAMFPMIAYETIDSEGHVPVPCNMDVIDGIVVSVLGQKIFPDRRITEYQRRNVSYYYNDVTSHRGIIDWPVNDRVPVNGFISYQFEKEWLKIYDKSLRGTEVAIGYTGILTDDEGYPLITRKQANAIAAITARDILLKAALRGDKNKAAMLEYIERNVKRLIQAASLPEDISDNQLDEMMDAKVTFNRKTYKRPMKYGR